MHFMRTNGSAHHVQLYGWDARTRTWSGPTGLSSLAHASPRLLDALRAAPGKSWFGPLNCTLPGQAPTRFFTLIHALRDCALAMIYCSDSRTGPLEVVVAIPAGLPGRVRPDFTFEFVAFARFLEALSEDAALTVHDLIAASIAEAQPADALVFSISTGLWPSDLDDVLSNCIETAAVSMLQWVAKPVAA